MDRFIEKDEILDNQEERANALDNAKKQVNNARKASEILASVNTVTPIAEDNNTTTNKPEAAKTAASKTTNAKSTSTKSASVKTVASKKTTTSKAKAKPIEEVVLDEVKSDPAPEEVVQNNEAVNKAPGSVDALKLLAEKKTINSINNTTQVQTKELKEDLKDEEKKIEVFKYPRYYDTPILEGLSNQIVEKRVSEGLVNVGNESKGKTIPGIIISNTFTFFNMLYLIITILFILLKAFDNLFFLVTIIPNLLIGIYQEIKAKISIDKLSLMSTPTTTVVRNGQKIEIGIKDVVLDDIIFYTSGKQICADSIVKEGLVEVNESLLTGEADAIIKNPGDQLLSGSFVVSGVCVARVDKVGKDNYIEKLSKDAKMYQKPKSELLRSLNGILKIVSIIILPLAVLTYIAASGDLAADFLGLNRESIIKTASSMLAMIPAGLFLLTSLALFVSVARLAGHKTLVQELYCIEMLARVNVLCLDKTGTITDGSMRVTDCIEIKNPTDYTIREIVGSMMYSFEDTNPTSEALVKYFDKNKVLESTGKIPFSSKRKFSAVSFGEEGTFIIGAPEFILNHTHAKISDRVDRFASDGYRVLVLVQTNETITMESPMPKNITPICLIVLQDHIREDANDTIDYFKQNGVDIKVISGDNPITVSNIAKRAGVEGADRYINLAGLSDDEVRDSIFEYNVFGRVSPNQKRVLVQALKDHKKVVAMTGDGVNDILALKEADCSIAMASGSEATRYVSHLVLTDSNFASMPKVVQEGRRVINNIQKTSTVYFVKTLFSILLTVLYIILGLQGGAIKMSYPFSAKNLYMIEFCAIGIPSFFLALQPNTDLVKGKFLVNIIKTTLPGALTVVILHLILNFLRITPGFGYLQTHDDVFVTILTLVTTAVSLVVLFRVCRPFNWWRRSLYGAMLLGCILLATNAFPFMNLELSYRKPINEYKDKIELRVNKNGLWELYNTTTSVIAVETPNVTYSNADGYLKPVISVSDKREWKLNGITTLVKVNENDVNLSLKVENDMWILNDIPTEATAHLIPTYTIVAPGYLDPVLTINERDYWVLDGEATNVMALGNDVKLTISSEGEWILNGSKTNIKAKVMVEIINPEEYVLPNISVFTKSGRRYYMVNNTETNVEVSDSGNISLVVENGKWKLNNQYTEVEAVMISDGMSDVDYVMPTLDINSSGYYTLNDVPTEVMAEDNLLVTEIILTIVLVQLILPCMYFIDKSLKGLKV